MGKTLVRRYGSVALLFVAVAAFIGYFAVRYDIGFNGAPVQCLHAKYFIVDTWDKNIHEGDLVAFEMNKDNEYFPKGLKWIKIAAAKPSSVVNKTPHSVTTSSGKTYNVNMSLMVTYLNQKNPQISFDDFTGEITTKADEWFVLGETESSYDSRYWGPIKTKDIIGKAYAIF